MNSFRELANAARVVMMRETGMDDLDYHLTILEGGSAYLDEIVKPAKDSSLELVALYKEHLTNLGFWNFYVFLFSHLEVGLAERWMRAGSIESYQSTEWRRAEFLKEVQGLPWNRAGNQQFDTWLKALGRSVVLKPDTVLVPQH